MTFAKMGFRYTDEDIQGIINNKPLAIENALRILKVKIEMYIKLKNERKPNPYSMHYNEHSGGMANNGGMAGPHLIKNDSELPQINSRGVTKAKSNICNLS